MIRSMTGYGAADSRYDGYALHVEIRSVNARFAELTVRLPREWLALEEGVRRAVQPYVKRGRVDIAVTVEREAAAGRTVEVDWALVDSYRDAAEQIRSRLGMPDSEKLSLSDLLQVPGLVSVSERRDFALESGLQEALLLATREAAERFLAARAAEGSHLQRDVEERLSAIERMEREVRSAATSVAADYRARLTQKLAELLGERSGGVPDETRLTMEVALLAERSDIQEELTRLGSHLAQCRQLLLTDEPIGRKLDFFIQEMNREVNTIGSKANRVDIVGRVVDMKAELEKLREQAQNIE